MNSSETDSSGLYNIRLNPGRYDVQFSTVDFSFKLLNCSMFTKKQDIVKYIDWDGSTLKVGYESEGDKTIQITGGESPKSVSINSTILAKVDSLQDLTRGSWFYNPSENKIYIKTSNEAKSACPFECCGNEANYFEKQCSVGFYCSEHQCLSEADCPFECCYNEATYLDKACSAGKSCYNRKCLLFADDFESGDLSKWIPYAWSGIVDVQNSIQHDGIYSLNVSNYADQAWGVQTVYKDIDASQLSVRLYFL